MVNNAIAGVQDAAGGRTFTRTWCPANVNNEFGSGSLPNCGKGGDSYRWTPTIAADGSSEPNVPVTAALAAAVRFVPVPVQ